jgi:putative membrane protein
MSFMMVAFWTIVVIAVVAVVRATTARREGVSVPSVEERPERILDQRLARGEIDADEYRLRRDAMRAT